MSVSVSYKHVEKERNSLGNSQSNEKSFVSLRRKRESFVEHLLSSIFARKKAVNIDSTSRCQERNYRKNEIPPTIPIRRQKEEHNVRWIEDCRKENVEIDVIRNDLRNRIAIESEQINSIHVFWSFFNYFIFFLLRFLFPRLFTRSLASIWTC